MRGSPGNRVLMLLENSPYVSDSRVRREAETLVGAGYQVTVISPANSAGPGTMVLNGVRVYRYPLPPTSSGFLGYLVEYGYSLVVAFFLSIYVFFRHGFDIIHAHNPPDLYVLIAAFYKPFGKRFVFDHHDLAPEMYYARFGGQGNPLVFRALQFFERLSCRLADHVIATNHSYRAMEMERGGVPAERITVVRNAPDPKRMRLVEPDPQLRQSGKAIIGYVGALGAQDGLDYLLRALRHLVYDLGRTDFYCVIVGKGDTLPALRQLATELRINDHVHFTGWVSDDDLLRYLSSADICVDPDPKNPFNDRSTMIKMMEYMALAKPIVAFDLTEHRVTAQDAAVYARPNDELDFARRIAELIDDPERRRVMGLRGQERVTTQLEWSHQAAQLLSVYDRLAPVAQTVRAEG